MVHGNIYQKLGSTVSQMVQLRAEEKWLNEAMEKIRNERNCLQIERLHVESLKAKLIPSWNKTDSPVTEVSQLTTTSKQVDCNVIEIDNEEKVCNNEELNLMVFDSSSMLPRVENYLEEEEDEEEEEDDEEIDCDDMLIDINMLMQGNKMD